MLKGFLKYSIAAAAVCFLSGGCVRENLEEAAGDMRISIGAKVDAVRVAKVKNMYVQDLRRTASTLDVRLQPYVSAFSNGFVQTPVAGLSLAVSF